MGHLPRELSQNAHSDVMQTNVPAAARYFDYGAAVALRNLAAAYGTAMPRYLLAPEVAVLLSHEPDQKKRLLIETFWNTGGRLNEVLPLTPDDFVLDGPDGRPVLSPFVVLHTLKQRTVMQRARPRGRPTREEQAAMREAQASPPRAVPLTDPAFAMHLVQHGVPKKVIQAMMGHKDEKSTEWYTQVLALDVTRQLGVRFSMNAGEARALLLPGEFPAYRTGEN